MKAPQETAMDKLVRELPHRIGDGYLIRVVDALTAANILHHPGPTVEEFAFALARHGSGMHESYMAGQSWARWADKLHRDWSEGKVSS